MNGRCMYLRLILAILLLLGAMSVQAASNPRWATTISQSPVSVNAGQLVTFSAEFQVQQGPIAKLRVVGGIGKKHSSKQAYSQIFQNLGKNQRQQVSFRWRATEGTHLVYFMIDPQQQSTDSNRSDNRIQLRIKVNPAAKAARPATIGATGSVMKSADTRAGAGSALPNIVVEQAYVRDVSNPAKKKFYPGDHLQLLIKLGNSGQVPTGSFWVQVLETRNDYTNKSIRDLKKSVPSLAPGQYHEIVFDIGVERREVDYRWEIFADYNNRVQEFSESTKPDMLIEIDIRPSQ